MKYVLDFDRVIFDVDAYYREVAHKGLTALTVHPSIWDTLDARSFVYPDASSFFKKHSADSVRILTAMRPELGPLAREYQRRKVAEAGVEAFVKDVTFMEGLKGPYLSSMHESVPTVFVDDKIEQIMSAREHCPQVSAVHLVRTKTQGASELGVTDDLGVLRISSLEELDNILGIL